MTKLYFIIFILLSSLILPYTVIAKPTDPAAKSNISTSQEIQLLSAQLEATKDYQDQFISIVQWSLGAVFAMALGLAAFNWFSSKISYDRDIKALRTELSSHVEQEQLRASNRLIKTITDKEKDIKESIIGTTKEDFDKIRSQLSSHDSRFLSLEYCNTEREAVEAKNEKIYTWAIYKYCDLLDISVKGGTDHYEVDEILDEISKLLEIEGIQLSSADVTHTTNAIKRLPGKYKSAADNLMPKISKAHK